MDHSRWAPSLADITPVSPSTYELLRACPLHLLYARDESFPRRSSPYARIGSAFHRTLEHRGTWVEHNAPESAAKAAVAFFETQLQIERNKAAATRRESDRGWPEERAHQARLTLALLAHRVASSRPTTHRGTDVEVRLKSRDGLLVGIVDRVDRDDYGVELIDYKTAAHVTPEALERYERQMMFYAYLWHEHTGMWPTRLVVAFLLQGDEHHVPLDLDVAVSLADDARSLARRVAATRHPVDLARPGPACRRCEYRPWCLPFWNARLVSGNRDAEALATGIEVTVIRLDRDSAIADIEIQGTRAQLVLEEAQANVRRELRPGDALRVIDAHIDGVWPYLRLRVDDTSEVWCVE